MSKKISVEISEETYNFLKQLQHKLDTQPNRATAKPLLYFIEETWRDLTPEGCGEVAYWDDEGNLIQDWTEEILDYCQSYQPRYVVRI